jgi:hypothetical protein
MESRFGHDFSRVRIHVGPLASASAEAVDALAYTVGEHIVFAQGQYAPGTARGKHILAHELAHVTQQGGSHEGSSKLMVSSATDPLEKEADHDAKAALSGHLRYATTLQSQRRVQRYSHEDCSEADLRGHIWPGDHLARGMVAKAVRVLRMKPVPASVTPLLSKYFQAATPDIPAILRVFSRIHREFAADDYQYECEEDCDDANAYVYGIWTDVHLCMNQLRGRANDCFARTIIHEFSHYAAGTDDEASCYGGCGPGSCPSGLDADDAADNAYSYAAFAYELWSVPV